MNRFRIILTLTLLAAALALPAVASAHATLVQSDPPANSVVPAAPPAVRLTFSEAPDPGFSHIEVYDSSGRRVDQGATHADPADALTLSVALNAPLPDGVHTVSWRVLSTVDSHVTQGVFAFAVGTAGPTALPAPSQTASEAPDALAVQAFARWLNLLAAALAAGGPVFLLAIWRPAWRSALPDVDLAAIPAGDGRLARRAQAFLPLAMLVFLMVQAVVAAGGTPADGLDAPAVVRLVTGSRFGAVWLARLALVFALMALGLPDPADSHARMRLWGAIGLGALLLLTGALVSHAAAAPDAVLPVANDWLHLAAASVWLGGLVSLAISLPPAYRALDALRRTRLTAEIVSRFSVLGLLCVSVLMLTGLIQGNLHVVGGDLGAYVRPDGPLFTTGYGRTLLVKLLLILPLVGTAGINLLFIGPRLRAGVRAAVDAAGARQALLATVRVEIALLLAVLAAVGLLTSLPPALQAGEVRSSSLTLTGKADNLGVTLSISPGHTGTNDFTVRLSGAGGEPYDAAKEVDLQFQPLDVAGTGSASTGLAPRGGGRYEASGAFLSLNGRWRIDVAVRRPDAFDAFARFDVDVAPAGAQSSASQVSGFRLRWPLVTGILMVVAGMLAGLAAWRNAPRRAGAVLGVLCATVLAVPGAATAYQGLQTPAAEIVNPLAGDPAAIAAGQVIYSQDCAACHGLGGRGDGPAALSLSPRPSDFCLHMQPGTHTDAEIFDWISNGVPGSAMRGWGGVLNETQRWQVYAYLKAQFGTPGCAGVAAPAATP